MQRSGDAAKVSIILHDRAPAARTRPLPSAGRGPLPGAHGLQRLLALPAGHGDEGFRRYRRLHRPRPERRDHLRFHHLQPGPVRGDARAAGPGLFLAARRGRWPDHRAVAGRPRARRDHVGVHRQPQPARRRGPEEHGLHVPRPPRPQAPADRPEGHHPDGERRHHSRLLQAQLPPRDLHRRRGGRPAARGAEGPHPGRLRLLEERHPGAGQGGVRRYRRRPRHRGANPDRGSRPADAAGLPGHGQGPEGAGRRLLAHPGLRAGDLGEHPQPAPLGPGLSSAHPPFVSASTSIATRCSTPPTSPASTAPLRDQDWRALGPGRHLRRDAAPVALRRHRPGVSRPAARAWWPRSRPRSARRPP